MSTSSRVHVVPDDVSSVVYSRRGCATGTDARGIEDDDRTISLAQKAVRDEVRVEIPAGDLAEVVVRARVSTGAIQHIE